MSASLSDSYPFTHNELTPDYSGRDIKESAELESKTRRYVSTRLLGLLWSGRINTTWLCVLKICYQNPVLKHLSQILLFKSQLNCIGLSVPHRKHITSPLRAQQVNAIYRFVTMVY
jgi:hypothetical protein